MKRTRTTHPLTTFTALLVALFLTAGTAGAQGFIKNYPVQADNHFVSAPRLDVGGSGYCLTGTMIPATPNPNFVFFRLGTDGEGAETSYSQDTFQFDGFARLVALGCGQFAAATTTGTPGFIVSKFDAQGTLFWRDTMAQVFPGQTHNLTGLCGTADDGILLVGEREFFVQKFAADGTLLHTTTPPPPIPGGGTIFFGQPKPTPDGGALIVASTVFGNTQVYSLVKIAPNCTVEWATPAAALPGSLNAFGATSDGDYLVLAGAVNGGVIESSLVKYAPDGTLLWSKALSPLLGQSLSYLSFSLVTNDNGALVCGVHGAPGAPHSGMIARFDSSGNMLWKKVYNQQEWFQISDGKALPDGSFALTGTQSNLLMLLKIGPNGQILPNALSGTLVLDANSDCVADTSEARLSAGWIVTANALGTDYYAVTDSSGNFLITDLPGGPAYPIDLAVLPPSYAWLPCPPSLLVMPADTTGFTLHTELAVGKLLDCPVMTLDIGMPPLRRCVNRTFSLHYCNSGTLLAEDAAIEVYLPDEIEMVSSPAPYTQTGQTVRFELGDVPAGDCGLIQFVGYVSCDSAQLGQTLCLEAHIFPDSFCINPGEWSGASLEADAHCLGDTVQLSIQNTGTAPTTQSLEYLIIDDDVVMRQGTVPSGLPASGIQNMKFPADGSTLRILVEQEPHHPVPGNPSIAVEGCGGWTLGFVTQFPNEEGNPFGDIECREVVGSYDPNEKQAYPQGVHSERFIEPGTPLTYVLHFQNTGTDTAFQVVLRDTLSAWLDPATVRPGASNHPYRWNLTGKGELVFRFDPIALPDSNANVEASQGYVQFAIQMRPDVPLGTVIENRVGIYFDQNPVVLTNTVRHRVDTGFLKIDLSRVRDLRSMPLLSVRPNPAADAVYITLTEGFGGSQTLLLSDAFGKTVLRKTFSGGTAELHRGELPAGIYFAKMVENERVVAVGKVVWR